MKIDKNMFGLRLQLIQNFIRFAERTVDRRQKYTALQVDQTKLLAICLNDGVPKARRLRRVISRTNQPRLIINPFEYILVIPCMITHCNAMNAPAKKNLWQWRP